MAKKAAGRAAVASKRRRGTLFKDAVGELWKLYAAKRDSGLGTRVSHGARIPSPEPPAPSPDLLALRNRLVVHYWPWACRQAAKLKQSLPQHVDADDLVGELAPALIDCVERFDPARVRYFVTFAGPRIRGAMLDWIRRQDHLKRHRRETQTACERVAAMLAQKLGRRPSTEEIARQTGCEPTPLCAAPLSLSGDPLVANHSAAELQRAAKTPNFEDLMKGLEAEAKFRLRAIYRHGMTQQAVAAIYHVCPSRISQMIKADLAYLAKLWANRRMKDEG